MEPGTMPVASFVPALVRASGRRLLAAVALAAGLAVPARAHADVIHVVARGHTLEKIANRYHVTVRSIVEANRLRDPSKLKVGSELRIPGVVDKSGKANAPAGARNAQNGRAARPPTYAARPKVPNQIKARRWNGGEEFTIRVMDRRGRVAPTALKTFERVLRANNGQAHAIDPRLIALLATVSNHFGGRPIEIVSGYRPYASTQHTRHSNHNAGRAIDFRVSGVPNEVVRDFCKTLRNVGVGYYPNSTFVHLDVRSAPAFWIDYSRPGEPPRYNSPDVDADEGTSDVAVEVRLEEPPSESDHHDGPTAAPADADSTS
jgi:uncharacterized protein YcbK (DUF882 family)